MHDLTYMHDVQQNRTHGIRAEWWSPRAGQWLGTGGAQGTVKYSLMFLLDKRSEFRRQKKYQEPKRMVRPYEQIAPQKREIQNASWDQL